jgi:hypothetical protein
MKEFWIVMIFLAVVFLICAAFNVGRLYQAREYEADILKFQKTFTENYTLKCELEKKNNILKNMGIGS